MRVSDGSKYEIPLLSPSTSRPQSITQIISSLNHLSLITSTIFNSINTRLEVTSESLSSLKTRLKIASEKITNLKNSQNELIIISPAKFPSPPPMHFPLLQVEKIEGLSYADSEEIIGGSVVKRNSKKLKPVFHSLKGVEFGAISAEFLYGVGKATHLRTADSFFLYDSQEIPYLNYKVSERSHEALRPKLATTPYTPTPSSHGEYEKSGESEERNFIDDLFYRPSSREIPSIDLPLHLPNLPRIFDSPDSPLSNTTPSLFSPPIRPSSLSLHEESPVLSELGENHQKWTNLNSSTPINDPQLVQNSNIVSDLEKPLVPKIVCEQNEMIINTINNKIHNIPPPPPMPPLIISQNIPPPPPMLPNVDNSNKNEKIEKKEKVVQNVDVRSTLMSAIREAGGKSGLKKRVQQKSKEEISESSGGGDLMADLKNSLAMRRKGISGDVKKGGGLGDIMKSMAKSIPVHSSEDFPDAQLSEDDDWD